MKTTNEFSALYFAASRDGIALTGELADPERRAPRTISTFPTRSRRPDGLRAFLDVAFRLREMLDIVNPDGIFEVFEKALFGISVYRWLDSNGRIDFSIELDPISEIHPEGAIDFSIVPKGYTISIWSMVLPSRALADQLVEWLRVVFGERVRGCKVAGKATAQ